MHRFLDRLGRFLNLLDNLAHAAAVLILVVAGVAYLLLHSPPAPGRVSVTEHTVVVGLALSASADGRHVLATWGEHGYPDRIVKRELDGTGKPVSRQQRLVNGDGHLLRLARQADADGRTLAVWDEDDGGEALRVGIEGRLWREVPAELGYWAHDVAYSPRRREWLIAGVDPERKGKLAAVQLRRVGGRGGPAPVRLAPDGQRADIGCRLANEPRSGNWLLACLAASRVEAQVLDPDLHPIGPRRVLDVDQDLDAVEVAAGPGFFAVAWESAGYGEDAADLYVRTFDDRGSPRSPTLVADHLYGASEHSDLGPELAYHPRTGRLLLAYAGVTDPAQKLKGTQRIYGRRLTPQGRWLDASRVPLAPGREDDLEQRSPKVVPGPGRDWLVAWEGRNARISDTPGSYEVFAAPWRPAP